MKIFFLLCLSVIFVSGAPLTPGVFPVAIAPANIADGPLKVLNGNIISSGSITSSNFIGQLNGQSAFSTSSTFDTVNDLLSYNITSSNIITTAFVLGRLIKNDGGGGIFSYSPLLTSFTNFGTVFKPINSSGRWSRQLTGMLDIRYFGCSTNSLDSTPGFQDALNLAITNGSVSLFVPEGSFIVNSPSVFSNTSIYGIKGKSILQVITGGYYALAVNINSGGTTNVSDNIVNIILSGLTLRGNSTTETPFNQFKHLLTLNSASYVNINDCAFISPLGDGINLGSGDVDGLERHNEHIWIQNSLFDGVNFVNRNGISICEGTDIHINNNVFKHWSYIGMPGPIDIEPNGHGFERINSIDISGNFFEDNHGDGAIIMNIYNISGGDAVIYPYNVQIKNNYISVTNTFAAYSLGFRTTLKLLSTSPDLGFILENNYVGEILRPPLYLFNLKDYTITKNTFKGGNYIQIGNQGFDGTTNLTLNGTFSFNNVSALGGDIGMLSIGKVQNLKVAFNNISYPTSGSTEAFSLIDFYGNITNTAADVSVDFNTFTVGAKTNLISILGSVNCKLDTNYLMFHGNVCNDVTLQNLYSVGVGSQVLTRYEAGDTSVGNFTKLISKETVTTSPSTLSGIYFKSDQTCCGAVNVWAGINVAEYGDFGIIQGLSNLIDPRVSGTNRLRMTAGGQITAPNLQGDVFTTGLANITNFHSSNIPSYLFVGNALDTNYNGLVVKDFADRFKIGYSKTTMLGSTNTPIQMQWVQGLTNANAGSLEIGSAGFAATDLALFTANGVTGLREHFRIKGLTGNIVADQDVSANTLTSIVPTGIPPLSVISSNIVTNLNVQYLGGHDDNYVRNLTNAIGFLQTGRGFTNNGGVYSNNIVAGVNINITSGANGQLTITGTSTNGGTVTNVAMTVPAFLAVTGSPITSGGTLGVSYSGTALPIANGGTAGTTAALARTSLGLNTGLGITNTGSLYSNNIVAGANTVITSGANGQLTISSTGGFTSPTGNGVVTVTGSVIDSSASFIQPDFDGVDGTGGFLKNIKPNIHTAAYINQGGGLNGTDGLYIGYASTYPDDVVLHNDDTIGGFSFVTGGGGTVINKIEANGDVAFKHVGGSSLIPQPTFVVGTGAGTSGGAATIDTVGNDISFTVTIAAGLTPANNATIFTCTFGKIYSTIPHVIFSPSSSNAANAVSNSPYVTTVTTAGFIFKSNAVAGLTASQAYDWTFHILK